LKMRFPSIHITQSHSTIQADSAPLYGRSRKASFDT